MPSLLLPLVAATLAQTPSFSLSRFLPERREAYQQYERSLNAVPDPAQLRAHHELLADEPHVAGTEGDHRTIADLETYFRGLGLEVETQWLKVYLSRPISAEVSLINDNAPPTILGTTEPPIDEDPYSRDPRLTIAWNAYSGSGDVTANVIYANRGTKEDFDTLKKAGIDCTGKIIIARYGGNFRGYKAKFAEEAGAAALIIYTDPADSGYTRGLMYPQGGWSTASQVQCGSIMTLDRAGDPLTPFVAATEDLPDNERLTPDEVGLPKIPVQPMGWEAVQQIMQRMHGRAVADTEGCDKWQGGLPLPYRIEGGPALKVRVNVQQERGFQRTANVVATLKGAKFPDEKIIIGCHHDAWAFGACDPLCGTILVLESARSFAQLAKAGSPPDRSILFACWGAEEFGIIGSTEWVEAHYDDLAKNAIAYINLDMATMGDKFWASAAPSLKSLIIDAAKDVPHCRQTDATRQDISVYGEWLKRSGTTDKPATEPVIGDLGGGSDHVAFYCHAGVPSMAIGSGGARGTSYHSNYDTLNWYHAVVGDDYLPAQMNTRMVNTITSRLANADILPLDPTRFGDDGLRHLDAIEARAKSLNFNASFPGTRATFDGIKSSANDFQSMVDIVINAPKFAPEYCRLFNQYLRKFESAFIVESGLSGRAWFRNLYASPDQQSGYDSWMLPSLRLVVEYQNETAIQEMDRLYSDKIHALTLNSVYWRAITDLAAAGEKPPSEPPTP